MANNKIRLVLVLTIAAFCGVAQAAQEPATLSGHVQDSSGKPQMGAVVEVFTTAAAEPLKAFTDAKGFYSVVGLLPGNYFVKATATRFLPSLRENISLRAGSHVLVNMTLNTLVEAFQLLPPRKSSDKNDDDWRWTLRSAANRPILRVVDEEGPLVVVSKSGNESDRTLKARVAFIAGSDGENFNAGDVKTAFNVEQSMFGSGTVSFNGNFGYNAGVATGTLRTTYRHEMANGSMPEISITARRFASPDTVAHHAALSALAIAMADNFSAMDFLDFRYGGEMQSVQFRGRVAAFRPFGSVGAHFGKDTLLEYSYTTSRPTTRASKGFDSSPVDLSETDPRVSLRDSAPELERARHQEIALSRRVGKNNFQAAAYSEHIRNTVVTGVGNVDTDFADALGDFLPDVYSNSFAYSGGNFDTQGFRLVAERKFNDALTATMNYSYGGSLIAERDGLLTNASENVFKTEKRHAVTAKVAGHLPACKTSWIASYKWTSDDGAVIPVDMFNASAGQSDPYLNVFIRQPIPSSSFFPVKMEALIDVRNLMSQGYVPMIGSDGRTLYLVQSERSIRGGVAFNF